MTLSAEMSLVTKLLSLDLPVRSVFTGLTSQSERMAQVREAVKKVPEVTFTVAEGKRVTMAMQFYRAYNEEL